MIDINQNFRAIPTVTAASFIAFAPIPLYEGL
jgi:hypothetical protein